MAACVLFEMRLTADIMNEKCMVLRSVASSLRRRHFIDSRISKQLTRIDDAAALLRHATRVRSKRQLTSCAGSSRAHPPAPARHGMSAAGFGVLRRAGSR